MKEEFTWKNGLRVLGKVIKMLVLHELGEVVIGDITPLDKQENNVVFKSKRVQQMVQNGAKTVFDIWYEWDKSLYADDEKFSALPDYIKEVDTQTDF